MADPNFSNRTLFHGDNLPFLRGMDSETVDLVATDPPFNKSRDFHATPDSLAAGARFVDRWSWDKDVHPDWIDSIKDNWPGVWAVIEAARVASGDDMAAFLCWLSVRVMELHRILKPTGSLYLHIDHTAHAWVKALLDGVFGRKNFVNEIAWCYKSGGASPKRHFSRKHDIILFYKRGAQYTFNPQREKSYNRGLKPYRFKGVEEFKDAIGWYTLVGMKDYWQLDMVGRTSSERMGYPTQKPLALYERMILSSSSPSDVILDPFCGCATTPIAAERLGRRWVGMDIWDGAFDTVRQRMEDNRQLLGDIPEIHYSKTPPLRTDMGQEAAPTLVLKLQVPEPPGLKMSHAEMKQFLIQNEGIVGKGCLRKFDDERYLDLDHNVPRSDGGINHISNRMLLCSPCNRAKSNMLTLSGLRRLNKQNDWMAKE